MRGTRLIYTPCVSSVSARVTVRCQTGVNGAVVIFTNMQKRPSPHDMSNEGLGVHLLKLLKLAWRQSRQKGTWPQGILYAGHVNIPYGCACVVWILFMHQFRTWPLACCDFCYCEVNKHFLHCQYNSKELV